MQQTPIVAHIRPTPARRAVALGMLFFLGGMLVYLALASPQAHFGWQALLVAMGLIALLLGEKMRRATALGLEWDGHSLRDSAGRVLCRLDEIAAIERGIFAFKPSHGFVLKMAQGGPAAWAPGLWWRFGRRLGVGGVTPSAQGKFMAELIAQALMRRDGTS